MRVALTVVGVVQGVGFRPFVRRAALARGLAGWVRNARDGVHIEVQGPEDALRGFEHALRHEAPESASIERLERLAVDDRSEDGAFRIFDSEPDGPTLPVLPADLAMCPACRADLARAGGRHHGYAFTSCAQCGPRYAITHELPYDRDNTTMRSFAMCDECAREYGDIDDRRYHAQPIACAACGPRLSLWDAVGTELAVGDAALRQAAQRALCGQILALRGLGGFQLIVDASDDAAVQRLRQRKKRPHRPFALMFPSLEAVASAGELGPAERALLEGARSPIVLLRRRANDGLAASVAPDSPWIGAMLPYTPLHRLLLDGVQRAVVCTSGNLSDEPMAIELHEALRELGSVADVWLSHDRPIARPLDDSVVRVVDGGPQVLRRARGYVPLPVARLDARASILALGAHLKSSAALCKDGRVVLGQHIGDLDSPAARDRLAESAEDLCRFFAVEPERIACDLHPDYASTELAERIAARLAVPLVRVQHHHAHVAACMAEHGLEGEVLGLAWDGTGYGADGSVWGGEALRCDAGVFERVGHLATFRLPGGDRAARSPWRAALGVLEAAEMSDRLALLERWQPLASLRALARATQRGAHAPLCSSIGRLFDAVAALIGLLGECSYEGQAAVMLEALAMRCCEAVEPYPLPLTERDGVWVGDTRALLIPLLGDVAAGRDVAQVALGFHRALIGLGVALAERAAIERVVLAGGCFQNRLLHEELRRQLERAGFSVYTASAVPPNDGGVAVGQIYVAAAALRGKGRGDVSGNSR